MVETQIEGAGIRDAALLAALRDIPRHEFVPPSIIERAYEDGAQPVECGQTISQPYMVAKMTELLELTPTDRVLEIGTGTGYQTAILARLAAHVFTVEWHLKLMLGASARLNRLGIENVTYRCGDGSVGWAEYAPFDAIIVTAGAPALPEPLVEQLAVGGRLVIPVGDRNEQTLLLTRRTPTDVITLRSLGCRFVKLVGEAGWHE
ncbi:MAG: protein-L-isoaspartate O-methyltransferase [Planctomycetota bacterium]